MSKKPQSNLKPVDPYKDFSTITGGRIIFKSNTPFIPQYVTSNLSSSSNPSSLYSNRVQNRQLLLENPLKDQRKKKKEEEKKERIKESKRKRKLGIIGKREVKEKSVWKLDKANAKYQLFLPLHHLWMSYMSELLGLLQQSQSSNTNNPNSLSHSKAIPASSTMHPKLVKADFHGSIMTVRQSKNPCLVGLSGIVLHETENAFKVITKTNAIKLLPKQNSIFAFSIPLYSTLPPSHKPGTPLPLPPPSTTTDAPEKTLTVLDIPHFEFELYGNQFRFRSADRAGRKFKHKETIEL